MVLWVLGTAARLGAQALPLVQAGTALPPLLDLRDARVSALVPADVRDPLQVERARQAWGALLAPHAGAPALRLRLPMGPDRLPLLLAASQAWKASGALRPLYLAFEPGAPPLMEEAAWGALDGGVLTDADLGADPGRWAARLAEAQGSFPGRPWLLWLPVDPGPFLGTLLGDGGRLVVPSGGAADQLGSALPPGFTEVEGGLGDLTLRNRSGSTRRWRFLDGAWKDAPLPPSRTEVVVSAADTYDVPALLGRMRATQQRDRAALHTFEADLSVDLHLQGGRSAGADLGFSFRAFEALGDAEELLQQEVRFNGVKAKLPEGVQLPVVESRASLAPPVALGLSERYRYADAGPAGPGRRKLRFDPVDPDPTLLHGELTVEEATGRILEERSERSDLPGTVKSERRILTYGPAGPGWRPLEVRTFERWVSPGGVNQVQRRLAFTRIRANEAGFEARRQEARAGRGTMLKQTPEGVRPFVRQGDGTRRIEEKPRTGGRAFGLALLMDPGLPLPVLPLGGLAFFDFNAFDRGIQVNAFTAGVFNTLAVAVPRLPLGLDLNANAALMLLSSDERPVVQGRLSDKDAVGRRFGAVSLEAGKDLVQGFRVEVQGHFQWDGYKEARKYATEGFRLPPSGWTRELRGELSWLWRGFQLRTFYGKGHRPEGVFGTADALQTIPDGGAFARWGGSVGLDRELRPGVWFHAVARSTSGRSFDRFNALEVGGLGSDGVAGIRANALAADRLGTFKTSVTVPTGPNLRLTLGLDHARARGLGETRTYAFTGANLTGDLPGFGWFTACRVQLGLGLASDVPGVKTVNGMVTLLRVF